MPEMVWRNTPCFIPEKTDCVENVDTLNDKKRAPAGYGEGSGFERSA